LREVARRAGVSIATLYRHFPTREALLEALLADAFDALVARADELLAGGDPGQAFAGWIRELAEGVARYDGLPAAVATALHDPDSTLHASCARLGATTANLLAQAQHSGAVREDLRADEVLSLVSAVAWAARQPGKAAPPDGVADRYLDLLLEGLATQHCALPAL
jgi:AcrR family transcriptional regulator